VMIDAVADRWLEWKQYPARSDYHHRRHLALLLQHHQEVATVDRRAASKFTADILQPGRDGATVIKMISTYRGLWTFLKREDIVTGENPWADLGPARQGTVKGVRSINGGSKRRAFTETEAQQLLGTMTGVDLDVAQVLAVSGMRLKEVTQLAPGDVNERGGIVWVEEDRSRTTAGTHCGPASGRNVAS
jgi:site-specific recombinase XerD